VVLHPARHKIGRFGDVPQANLLAWYGKTKANTTKEHIRQSKEMYNKINTTRMWANAQRDGRPGEYRWHPLFNATKFGCQDAKPVEISWGAPNNRTDLSR